MGLYQLTLLVLMVAVSPIGAMADSLKIGGSGADLGTMRQLGESYSRINPGTKVSVLPSMGSGGGINAVLDGAVDLAITTRPLKPEEHARGARERLYAITALVFIIAKNYGLESLDQKQVISIYDGRFRNWPNGLAVKPILRPRTDSDTAILRSAIPGMDDALAKAHQRRGIPVATTDQDSIEMISSLPGAIGTSTLALILGENRSVKVLKLGGVTATPASIKDGSYHLTKNMFFVTGSDPKPRVKDFLSFVFSKKGRAIMKKTGHHVVTEK